MAQLLSGTRVYGNTSIDSQLIVGNVTSWQATSNSTGSLIISGGVGITGNVYTGNIVITGITSNGITFADGTRQTTAAAAGAFLSNTSTLLTVNSVSQILITNTTTSTSNTTGALVVKGGVGVQGNVYADGLFVSGSSVLNTLTTANANISLLFAIDNYQNTIISVIQGTDTSQNTRIDYSNTAITILQGVNASQNVRIDYSNTAITILQGVNASQNVRIDYSNTAITIIQGTDVGQNSRMTIIENTDLSQNTRIDYSNTAITILQGVNAGQNANIAFVQTLANTDFTNVSITATTSSSNGLYIPVITVSANGRVTAISNTLITSSGGGGTIGILNDIITNASYYPMLSISSNNGSTLANTYTSNTKLTFNPSTGTLSATVFNSLSDENKKTNIKLIDNALEITENLNGVTFDWIENGLPSAGLIAQDVEKYLPQLITNSVENGKSLNYDGIIGVLVEAVKDLSQRIKELEKK